MIFMQNSKVILDHLFLVYIFCPTGYKNFRIFFFNVVTKRLNGTERFLSSLEKLKVSPFFISGTVQSSCPYFIQCLK